MELGRAERTTGCQTCNIQGHLRCAHRHQQWRLGGEARIQHLPRPAEPRRAQPVVTAGSDQPDAPQHLEHQHGRNETGGNKQQIEDHTHGD